MNFKNIVNKLCSQFDSKAYDQDILKYGLEVLIYNLFTILILIVLSILFQNCGFGLFYTYFLYIENYIGRFSL